MATAYSQQLFWQERHMAYATLECKNTTAEMKKRGDWQPPRVTDSDAVDQAAGTVDRFNRIFMRALRQLRDLRRYAPAVVVHNAGQVNVAERQVNVAESDR